MEKRCYSNCPNCINYVSKYFSEKYDSAPAPPVEPFLLVSKNPNSVLGDKYVMCKKGFHAESKEWWLNNGTKMEGLDSMPCFEQHESARLLDNCIKATDEMLKTLKERNKNI